MSSQSRGPQQTRVVESQAASVFDGGDLVVHYLEQLGVDYIFGIPGGAIEPLYNAMARSERRGGLRSVVARHESGAAFMADGYARETGKLGACCATTGPGATNLITGVACAYENEIPLLVITAQTALHTFGKGAFQESSGTGIDTVGMFQYCSRYNSLVSHPEQLPHRLSAAILASFRYPRGPSHLSIPLDVLRSPLHEQPPPLNLKNLLRRSILVDDETILALYREIAAAGRIALLIGPGCADAVGVILELALLLDASVVTTPQGKGLVSPYHPQFRGVFGFAGHASARACLVDSAVDLVLVVGTGLGEFASAGWDKEVLLNRKLIHVDANESHFSHTPMARMQVAGDPLIIFDRIVDRLHSEKYPGSRRLHQRQENRAASDRDDGRSPRTRQLPKLIRHLAVEQEAKYTADATPIKPQRLMYELARLFPATTRFLADSGNSVAWAVHYLHPFDRRIAGARPTNGGLFRTSLDFAPMGWAIGGAVGTALGRRGTPVVCITGDGSILMNGQEITVAVSERLPVIFVVLNDAALGMVKHGQRLAGAEPIGYELPPVDFCAMAHAMGVNAYTVRSPAELLALDIDAICARAGPTLLDVHIDAEEVPPMGVRMQGLGGL
ncbi:MAG: thiamine pyrophosphate-binding protein [Gammaproteobacteria bacterium]